VRTAKAKRQRLKPHLFCSIYVVTKVEDPGPAGATTHKHSCVATQTLQPEREPDDLPIPTTLCFSLRVEERNDAKFCPHSRR
jgi:hypothetical protein